MKVVWKYPLEITDEQIVRLPVGVQILDVQQQGQGLMMWVLVDKLIEAENFTIFITETGHDVPRHRKYIATVQTGPLVWHVWLK